MQKYLLFLICMLCGEFIQNSYAQFGKKTPTIAYITVIKTNSKKHKGILSQVNDSVVQMLCKERIVEIPTSTIQKIRVLRMAKNFKPQNLAALPWFETNINSQNSYLKQTGENIAANVAANVVFVGTQLAAQSLVKTFRNSNLAAIETYKINSKHAHFEEIKPDFERYSLYYQTHTSPKDQLRGIKEITESYRKQNKEHL